MTLAVRHLIGGMFFTIFSFVSCIPTVACDMCQHFSIPLCAAADDGPDPDFVAAFGTPRNGWSQTNPGDPVHLTYSYENMFDGGLLDPNGNAVPASQIRTAIEEAFEVWAEVAPLHFTEVPDDGLPYGQATQFGTIRIRHRFINGPDPPNGNPTTKAQARFPGNGLGSGDIDFDHGDPWGLIGTTREPDILGAAIHEIGHTLGLTHTNVVGANMYWIFKRHTGPGSGELLPDDIAAIQSVYGAGVGSVTPLGIPEPSTVAIVLSSLLCVYAIQRRRSSRLLP